MNGYENLDAFKSFDRLVDFLRGLPRERLVVLDLQRVRDMQKAAAILERALSEAGCTASVRCGQCEAAPEMGEITIEGLSIRFQDLRAFAQAARLARNAEVYPLVQGGIRMTFGFDIARRKGEQKEMEQNTYERAKDWIEQNAKIFWERGYAMDKGVYGMLEQACELAETLASNNGWELPEFELDKDTGVFAIVLTGDDLILKEDQNREFNKLVPLSKSFRISKAGEDEMRITFDIGKLWVKK